MDPRAEKILEKIRQGRECNIKTLNTIDTKTLKTLKTKNQHTFAHEGDALIDDEMLVDLTSSFSSGKAIEEAFMPLEENDSSQVVARPPEITYISASLKSAKTTRRTLNVDFRLNSTPGGDFNKLVFSLSDRRREFLSNIPKQHQDDWEYTEALTYHLASTNNNIWIGKGRPRGKFIKGNHINSKIQLGLSCVLEQTQKGYLVNLWIDGNHKEFELLPVDNKNYPFRYDSGASLETIEVLPRGGWK
jgi:hypothetical protein